MQKSRAQLADECEVLKVPPRSPVLAVCGPLPFRPCETKRFEVEVPFELVRWGFGEFCDLDPRDLLLPSLSDVRSTTLRTISLGEFETGLVGLSFSD
jgi:hypothetical protein